MTEVLNQFWNWFIIIPTVLGLLACVWLVKANSSAASAESKASRAEDDQSSDQGGSGSVGTMGHVWDEDLQEYNNPLPKWWLNLFYITLVFGAIYLLLYPGLGNYKGLLGWSQIQSYEGELAAADEEFGPLFKQYAAIEVEKLIENPEAIKTGRRLFSTYCTTCHGSDARGAFGFPNLRDDDWLYGGSSDVIKTSILNGRSGVMPPWGQVLKPDEQVGVAQYVRLLQGKAGGDVAKITVGQEKFNTFCVACHGAEGKGNPALGAPNLTDGIALYGNSERAIVKTIAEGRNGKMPAHRDFLGEDKIHLLTAYVYGLSKSANQGKSE